MPTCLFGLVLASVNSLSFAWVGDVTCLATVPSDMKVAAYFIAKEDGVVAGISLAENIFFEVDSSLKVKPLLYVLFSN